MPTLTIGPWVGSDVGSPAAVAGGGGALLALRESSTGTATSAEHECHGDRPQAPFAQVVDVCRSVCSFAGSGDGRVPRRGAGRREAEAVAVEAEVVAGRRPGVVDALAAGIRYVFAEIVAEICGNPLRAAARLIELSEISRPLTTTWLPLTMTKCWTRLRNRTSWK